ncbi:MAG TPA: hypothetical protein VJ998_10090 [Pseudomonadales bacterium]|nr:hypothetical protein [Pseudomonadales bacterium]
MKREIEAYPLQWPEGWPRTPSDQIDSSRFKVTPDAARRGMLEEIRRLVGHWIYRREDVIVSTNLRLRQDGEPYAAQRQPEDRGVAVYFQYKDRPMVFACDRWDQIHDNMHAIAKTIEALRGIERWGASDMLERAFTGFIALEHIPTAPWEKVLQLGERNGESNGDWLAKAERQYRILRKDAHPDHGGSTQALQMMQEAIKQAREALS